jgi:hypothetical protein
LTHVDAEALGGSPLEVKVVLGTDHAPPLDSSPRAVSLVAAKDTLHLLRVIDIEVHAHEDGIRQFRMPRKAGPDR